ncbi:hypothetical protein BX600DRAFT_434073 [Xylariales sp. PMI_506]|nr:hypothetical protein BX600DRAFT_434073 [Xylariales sp. PMI_506]
MPSQIASPIPITPPRKGMRLVTSEALYASLNATLNSTETNNLSGPVRSIKEREWDVPAPPPPSPSSKRQLNPTWPTGQVFGVLCRNMGKAVGQQITAEDVRNSMICIDELASSNLVAGTSGGEQRWLQTALQICQGIVQP